MQKSKLIRNNMKKLLLIISIISIYSIPSVSQEAKWYKGNTHTHTTNSDGNELPRRVVRWYLDHNYNFLVISDHSYLTDTKYLDTDKNDDFILIPGEEITDRAENKPVHLVAIGIQKQVQEQHGNTILETLQNNIDAIINAGGIAQINHPNWKYSFNDKVLYEVKDCTLVEIYNISKDCNNYEAGGNPGVENIWDKVLTKGKLIYGVISDDTHDYLGEFSADKSPPGRGWIMVHAKELTPEAIMSSIKKGDFYATVGVELNNVTISDKEYIVEIKPWGDAGYTTQFIGRDGKILKEDYNHKAVYEFKGNEGYVRAKVICSSGDFAITQPVFVK
jgi:hypothetical protein